MANYLEYAKIYQSQLDELAVQEARTGWMEANAGQVRYSGGDEVKIPKMALDGLAKYDRNSGYAAGSVSLEYETRKLTQDRGRKLMIDAMDVDETNFVVEGARVMSAFQTTKVIPEIDAYRMAKLYAAADDAGQVVEYTPAVATIVSQLKHDIKIAKKNGAVNPVIHISFDALTLLEAALATQLRDTTWSQGGVNTQVPSIDGCPLIEMADDRTYTSVTIDDDGGYTGSGRYNWIVVDALAAIAVSKQDVPRIFSPDQNQSADAWVLTYRKYHDLWVLDHKQNQVVANVLPSNATPGLSLSASTATVAAGSTTSLTATTIPAGVTVKWTSSDKSKATVANGTVTGVAAGEAVITAKATIEGTVYTDTCTVTVTSE